MRQSPYFLPRYILHNIIPMVLHKELLLSLSGRELWFYSYFFVGLHPWRIISTESRLTGSLNIRFKRTDSQETSRTSYYSFGGRSLAYYPSKHEGDCYPYVKDWAALKTGYKNYLAISFIYRLHTFIYHCFDTNTITNERNMGIPAGNSPNKSSCCGNRVFPVMD